MTTRIALLRGINVGGHAMVSMAALREFLTGLGVGNPRTLLQSGNVVFESDAGTSGALEGLLEAEAAARLDLRVDFFVRGVDEWAGIVAGNPFLDEADRDPSHLLVVLLKAAPDAPAAEADRRESDLADAAAAAGAEIERIGKIEWVGRCATLPPARVRLAGRDARTSLPGLEEPWAYDAGRRLGLVSDAASAAQIAARRGPEPTEELVARVREAITP
jgi:uncharacterized protein (DUF1697 family)